MAGFALAAYAVWFLVAFGYRTLVQVRRTGDSGWRGLSGRPGSAEWCAGVGFVVALVVGVAAPVAALAGLAPIFGTTATDVAGIVVTVVGIVLTFGAQLSMGNSWRIGVDVDEHTDLVTGGAFAVARNPIFSAVLVTAIGLVLVVPNVVAIVGLVVLVGALELQVRVVEEPYLLRVHGEDYGRYAARVGRFVPGLGHLST